MSYEQCCWAGSLLQNVTDAAVNKWRKRLRACMCAECRRRTFWTVICISGSLRLITLIIRQFSSTLKHSYHITIKLHSTYKHTHLTALFPRLPRWAGTRKVKPTWILLKQETVSGSGISCDICKSATRSRQITTQAPHHSVFYRPDALPVAQPTASKHFTKQQKNDNLTIGQSHKIQGITVF